MRELRKSGSVGALGWQQPGATRPIILGKFQLFIRLITKDGNLSTYTTVAPCL